MSAQAPRRVSSLLLVLAGFLSADASAAPSSSNSSSKRGIAYRWVDEHGVVHYGDRIPPQYVEKERAILNNQGVEVGHLDAQKSPEQVANETRKQQEVLKQKQHDSFLVTTYTSVKDIEALRDVRLDQLKGQRLAAEQYVENLRSRLASLQSRAMLFKPYSSRADARQMPDDLVEDLVRAVNEMRTQSNALAAKGEEETALKAQFQADIERYRELHDVHAQR
jgi:Domain of unknown function (DUF4124)